MDSFEKRLQQVKRDLLGEFDSARQHIVSSVGTKADFRDLDQLSQKLHMKLDIEQAKVMISEARSDLNKTADGAKGF